MIYEILQLNRPTFANIIFSKCRTFGCRILSYPTETVLYLVSLLYAPPIVYPTNHFLDREVFLLTCTITALRSSLEHALSQQYLTVQLHTAFSSHAWKWIEAYCNEANGFAVYEALIALKKTYQHHRNGSNKDLQLINMTHNDACSCI